MTTSTITTISMDEATPVECIYPGIVQVEKKPFGVKAIFIFPDNPKIRSLLMRYHQGEVLPIPARMLLIVRANLYRRARAVRGGL